MPICRVWQLGSRGRLELVDGRLGCGARGRRRGAGRSERAPRAHLAASRARRWSRCAAVATPTPTSTRPGGWRCGSASRSALIPVLPRPGRARLAARWRRRSPRPMPHRCSPTPGWVSSGRAASWRSGCGGSIPAASSATPTASPSPTGCELAGRHREAADLWATLSVPLRAGHGPGRLRRRGRRAHRARRARPAGGRPGGAKVRLDLRDRGVPIGPGPPPRLDPRQPRRPRRTASSTCCACSARASRTPRSPGASSSRRKTVDHHVSAILAKLHVANRRDAVRHGRAAADHPVTAA